MKQFNVQVGLIIQAHDEREAKKKVYKVLDTVSLYTEIHECFEEKQIDKENT